ncbi:Apolipoprotein of lipid transfer particle-I/II [Operophtera brumata]|uniref:Apolipoprotein of lipid transfer particle-I/II n=1 Tax=Operophtera brumata TaxID=104452 RepID=A0A0L7LGP6_OPEBR|nr:Apolipoprotein of lipid transfer particle-I/II [Operophtera brumata]
MSLVLVPKGQGEKISVRIKYEATPTIYTMSAHISGATTATVHARAELENIFTDINVKDFTHETQSKA